MRKDRRQNKHCNIRSLRALSDVAPEASHRHRVRQTHEAEAVRLVMRDTIEEQIHALGAGSAQTPGGSHWNGIGLFVVVV